MPVWPIRLIGTCNDMHIIVNSGPKKDVNGHSSEEENMHEASSRGEQA